jgi:hypothetical protein
MASSLGSEQGVDGMAPLSSWPRPALITLGVLLLAAVLGWGLAIERSSRVSDREEALAAAEARGRVVQQRVGEVEGTLTAERRATGDLAALQQRITVAQDQAATAEARANELRTGAEAAERQLADFRQQAAAEEQRLQGLRGEAGEAERALDARRAESPSRTLAAARPFQAARFSTRW